MGYSLHFSQGRDQYMQTKSKQQRSIKQSRCLQRSGLIGQSAAFHISSSKSLSFIKLEKCIPVAVKYKLGIVHKRKIGILKETLWSDKKTTSCTPRCYRHPSIRVKGKELGRQEHRMLRSSELKTRELSYRFTKKFNPWASAPSGGCPGPTCQKFPRCFQIFYDATRTPTKTQFILTLHKRI